MTPEQSTLKKTSIVALSALAVLLIISIVFYKERVLFADASYMLFNIVTQQHFIFLNQRYGAFISEVIPLLAVKMHLSIKAVLIGYGLSFNLFLLSVAAIIVFWHRQYSIAVLLAFYCFLFASDSFFMLADTQVAVGWMVLFFSMMICLGHKKSNIFLIGSLFILFLFLTISTHFIVIIPAVFLWVYFIIDKQNWPFSTRNSIIFSILFVLVVASKFFIVTSDSYDNNHLHGVTHLSLQDIIDSFDKRTVRVFLYRCLVNYWVAVIIFIISIVALVRERKFLLLIWTVGSVVGYIVLMGITYAELDGTTLLCHIELEWSCLGILVATPFVFSFLPKFKPSVAVAILITIFVIRLVYIGNSMQTLVSREHYKDNIMSQMKKKGINKLALYETRGNIDKCLIAWTMPYESIFASALAGEYPQRSFFYVNREARILLDVLHTHPDGFWDAYNISPNKDQNRHYITVDSTSLYQIMSEEELAK